MWSIKFVWCLLLVSGTFALPASPKNDTDSDAKPEPMITVDVIQMPADEKPTDNSKPSESMAVDPKPIDVKPTEQTKPNESSASAPASSASVFESIPLNVGPSRPQLLYDQRQDGKYNIRADLENFVILVVPSTGNSLLDLLKRSGQRQPQHNQHVKRVHHTKHHKKYHPSSGKPQVEVKKGANRLDYLNQGEEAAPLNGEFIEGRTPYHVDIQSDEILQPTYTGVRSLTDGGAVTIADLPLVNLEDNSASVSSAADASDATIFLSTVTGKQSTNLSAMPNTESSPQHRLPKSIIIGGHGNPFSNLNTVLLTPKTSNANDQQQQQQPNPDNILINNKNYNNYFSRKHSVQIVDRNGNVGTNEQYSNYGIDSMANFINSPSTELFDLTTDTKNSFNSLNVGNIDRLALAGDSTTRLKDADLANAQWELTLLGAEEQCGPDRRRDSYGVCQFVPADYATT